MGPTRKRDLTAAVVGAAAVGYLLVAVLYRWFPPITVWTGLSLLAVAVAEALWARYVRVKISDGEIGDGPGWLHPLVVARSLMVAKASAWVGALVTGWWIGVLAVLPAAAVMAAGGRRGHHWHGGGGGQRASVGGCRALAATLLQVSAGSDRARRRRGKLAHTRRCRALRRPWPNRRWASVVDVAGRAADPECGVVYAANLAELPTRLSHAGIAGPARHAD